MGFFFVESFVFTKKQSGEKQNKECLKNLF